MTGSYIINEIDLFTQFGWVANANGRTSDSFLIPNNEVDPYSFDSGDGWIQWDLSSPVVLKPRVFVLDGYIMASGFVDFWNKYNGLVELIRSGVLTIYVKELNKYFSAKRKSYTKVERFSRLRNTSSIAIAITIELDEVFDVPLPEPESPEGPGFNITPGQPFWFYEGGILNLLSFDYPDQLEVSVNNAAPVNYSPITITESAGTGYYRGRVKSGPGRNSGLWSLSPRIVIGGSGPVDPGEPEEPDSYDTELSFSANKTQTAEYVTATIPAVDSGTHISFNKKDCKGFPVMVNVVLSGELVGFIVLPNDYLGEVFLYEKGSIRKPFIIQEGDITL